MRADPELVARVRDRLARGAGTGRAADADVERLVRELGGVVGREQAPALARAVRAEVSGAGPLQPLLDEPDVTDVLVNGTEVWVDRGDGVQRAAVDVGTPADVRALAVRLAAAGGRRLDEACPVVDGALPDGTRLHAVLPPVADVEGVLLSLRTHRRRRWTLDALVRTGAVHPDLAPVLTGLVRRRANLLVSGATGAGKTTVLAALLGLVPPHERVLCVEEAPELDPDHPHVVRLVARRANVEGAGEVGLPELVRQALRMRPDRIVLGECRGAEVRDVLAALNTGHDGGCATVHANGVDDVPARLEALGAAAGMAPRDVATQAAAALDAVLHVRRGPHGRHVAELGCVGASGGRLHVEPVLVVSDGAAVVRPGWPAFARRWAGDGPRAAGEGDP